MTLLTKLAIVEAAIQADRNTPVAALSAIKAFDIDFNPYHAAQTIERMNATGAFGADPSLHGGHLAAVTLSWEITPTPDVANTEAPTQDALYRMAGFSGAAQGDNWIYSPLSSPTEMAFGQINFYFGTGRLRTMYGCVCSALTLTFNAREKAYATGTFVGFLISDNDVAPGVKNFSALKPYVCTGMTVSLGGVGSLPAKSLVFEMGLATPDRADMTHSSGFAPPIITDRQVTASLTLEQSLNAINDWRPSIEAATPLILLGEFNDPDFRIFANQSVIKTSTDGDDDGVRTDELALMCGRNTGNDELFISIGKAA